MRQVSYLGGLVTALAFILAACGGAPADVVETPVGAQSPAEEAAVTGPNTVEPAAAVEEEAPVPTEEMLLPEEDSPAAELPADDEEPTADEGAEAGSSALPEEVPEEGAAVEQEAEPAEVVPEEVDSPAEAAEQEPVATEELVETPPGPTEAQQQLLDSLTIKGTPPELHNEIWLNSEPLKLANLRGQVVIVEFWTYGWINCKNVIPSLREWHNAYQDDGLVIIGVHTPEFGYERDIENVKNALVQLDVPYPVAIDNDWATWRAYNNRYWPAKYFVDKSGQIRHIHIGEGRYQEQEEIIQALLAEPVS